MKRASLSLLLLLAILTSPAAVHADWLGAYLQGQAGYQKTNRIGHPTIGAAAALQLLFFEPFVDLRFPMSNDMSSFRGMFNQLGLRITIPLPAVKSVAFTPYAGISYLYSKVATADQDPEDDEDVERYKGLNPHVGARLDFILAPVIRFGLQAELGYHYLFPNDQKYSAGLNVAAFTVLKLDL